ncbi:DUF4350 domain-containing protein [Cellulomonas composti]|uniref:DUF4350 domain-containing protein n=1 Tax=Cellulomonas composti TaxID=266130 RepID=A0A511JAW9_9CELL|nr:DUF4350 domain-containing protein [Cellulomonas composti]GEL95141.1 hypothetical protein CCO02nite_17990 [Cellulomonas composti]
MSAAGAGSAFVVTDGPTSSGGPGGATDGGPVVGDGTSARSRAAHRWRRSRVLIGAGVLVVLVGLLALLPEPRTSQTPLAPDNPSGTGAMAVAEILRREGVSITYTQRFADVEAHARDGVTVAVFGDYALGEAQLEAMDDLSGDLVLIGATYASGTLAGIETTWAVTDPDEVLAARCDDPDAVAAGTITRAGALHAPAGATVCFPAADAAADEGAYVDVSVDGRRITVLGDPAMLTNAHLTEEGNAALALRMLGRHTELVWYVPSWDDPYQGATTEDEPTASMPPWVDALAWQLLLVVVVTAVWQGRRMGRLVTEPLPVVVRAGEAVRGRGRLYRRSRARGHAAAALRAGAASRIAERLGLPRSAPAPLLVDVAARACGWPAADVEHLLYGPPPTDDDGLARLARDLDHLESEVHRS